MFDDKKTILKRIWWAGLVGVCSFYFYTNYTRISTEPTAIDNAILVALLILVFMPLVSEISALGMTVKKEVNLVKEEMKTEVASIRNDIISLTLSNSNSQKVYVGLEAMPSSSEVKDTLKGNDMERDKEKQVDNVPRIVKDTDLSEEQVELYKIRYAIESKIREIAKYQDLARYDSALKLSQTLWRYGILSGNTYDKVKKVLTICNRAVHGELIEKDYIEYASRASDEVYDEFEEILKRKPHKIIRGFVVCTRCGYKGDAEYNNVCPECGFISDDE